MKLIFFLSLLVSSMSFANRESGGRRGAEAVYVYFNSYGTGIDMKALNQYQNLVAQAKIQNLVVDETSEGRGREGEVLDCVQLSSPSASSSFIRDLAPTILADMLPQGQKQRTAVYIGADCGDFSAATEQNLSAYIKP